MRNKRAGFTLLEIVISLAVLVIIIASTMSLLASSYSSLRDSEMRAIAKNVANYTLEYIRARNVTSDNPLGHDSSEFGNDATHNFPGLVDIEDNMSASPKVNSPLHCNGNYSATSGESNSTNCINTNPVLPKQTFGDQASQPYHKAFYYSLQGYVSLLKNPSSGTFPNHSAEDANLYIDKKNHYYHDMDEATNNGGVHTVNRLVVQFPFDASNTNNAIKSFTALPGYIPMVYTTDPDKVNNTKSEYSPFYTNDTSLKKGTMAYRGFRVLIAIVARKKDSSATHAQYFDVRVTVLWRAGKQEHSYVLSSQIVTYGGS